MTHDEAQTKAREIALRFYGPLDRSCEHLMDAITPALLDAQKEGVWACVRVMDKWQFNYFEDVDGIVAALDALLPKEEK